MVLGNVPFFKKFHLLKNFKQWRHTMRQSYYQKTRMRLAESFIFAKPIFMERYRSLVGKIEETSQLQFIAIKPKLIYGKSQQVLLDEKCKKLTETSTRQLNQIVRDVRFQLEKLRAEIIDDDKRFLKLVEESEVMAKITANPKKQDLILFSQARQALLEEQAQRSLLDQRHRHFNKLV